MKVLLFSVLFSIVFHYNYIIRNNVKLNVEYIHEFQNVLVFGNSFALMSVKLHKYVQNLIIY